MHLRDEGQNDLFLKLHRSQLWERNRLLLSECEKVVMHNCPALWHVLALSIKVSSSMDIFKKDLKTYLFLSSFWCLIELEYCEGCACCFILLFYVVCILVFLWTMDSTLVHSNGLKVLYK